MHLEQNKIFELATLHQSTLNKLSIDYLNECQICPQTRAIAHQRPASLWLPFMRKRFQNIAMWIASCVVRVNSRYGKTVVFSRLAARMMALDLSTSSGTLTMKKATLGLQTLPQDRGKTKVCFTIEKTIELD